MTTAVYKNSRQLIHLYYSAYLDFKKIIHTKKKIHRAPSIMIHNTQLPDSGILKNTEVAPE